MEPIFEKAGYTIARCNACGLMQLNPLPPRQALDELYTEAYFSGEGTGYEDYRSQAEEYAATFDEEIRRIRRYAPSGSVLDVGCGYGYFVGRALAAGYDAYGVDVSAEATDAAREAYPGRVYHGSIENVDELLDRRFNVVFASHLIEHIPEPVSFLSALGARLEDDGVLVMVTPNVESLLAKLSGKRWVSFKVPEHVAFYSKRTMSQLLQAAGYDPIVYEPALQYYRAPFVAKRLRELMRPVDRAIPPVERLPGLRRRIVRVTSGSLRVIARRAVRGR